MSVILSLVGGRGVSGSISRLVDGLVDGLVGRLVGRLIVASLTLVGDLSNIAIIAVDGVGNILGAAIGKNNRVSSVGVVALTLLVGIKPQVGIVILDLIGVLVLGRLLIGGLLVSRLVGRLVRLVGRLVGGPVDRGIVGSSDGSEGGDGKEGL